MKKRRRKHIDLSTEWVTVAGCAGTEETVGLIEKLFRMHGVAVEFEGSIRYDVIVHPKDKDRAVELIRMAQHMTMEGGIRLHPLHPDQ